MEIFMNLNQNNCKTYSKLNGNLYKSYTNNNL